MKAIYEPTGRAGEYSHLACNLYHGCDHGCRYCYVPMMPWNTRENFAQASPREGILDALERDACKYAGTDKRVLLCFTCDPYQPIEQNHQITYEAIRILRANKIPFQILTKGGYLAARDFRMYGPDDAFAVTLTSLDKADQQRDEPGAAPPSERLAALIKAHRLGIETWVSLEPVIDCEKSIRIIKETREYVDLYKIGTLNYVECEITPDEWRRFGERAINLLIAYGKKYYIKHDLQFHLGEFPFQNTDTRTVVR